MSTILKKTTEPFSNSPLERARLALAAMTDEQDKAITADALTDADNLPADALLAKRGRPVSDNPKGRVTIRLDNDVLTHFRAQGPGWQTRMNEALRKVAGLD